MAGDWIKMRGGLFQSPKLIAMSRVLHENRAFRDWMTPGGSGPMNGQIVSDHALRCVTGALLTVTWSWSREFGRRLPNGDCLLPHIAISDMDGIAGAPGIGEAMEAVGWAVQSNDEPGVILPEFFVEHNVPLTPAEKQRDYRQRKRESKSVTEPLPDDGNKTVTREEKRREEISSDDHVSVSWLKNRDRYSIASDWCKQHFRQGVGNEPPLFTASQATESRKFLLQVAAIALCGQYPEAWVAEALEAMRRLRKPPGNPGGYLRKLLSASPHIRGRPEGWFDALLKSIEVPES